MRSVLCLCLLAALAACGREQPPQLVTRAQPTARAPRPTVPQTQALGTVVDTSTLAIVDTMAIAPEGGSPGERTKYCPIRTRTQGERAGCVLLFRYVRAELAGWFWPAGYDEHLSDSAKALDVPEDAYQFMWADIAVAPVPCAAKRLGDTLSVWIRFGDIGGISEEDEAQGLFWGPPVVWRDGQPIPIKPPYRWRFKEYRAVNADGRWTIYYHHVEMLLTAPVRPLDWFEDGPIIGLKTAERLHPYGDLNSLVPFSAQIAPLAAHVSALPRPQCPPAAP